jgi:zinc-ribbon domain
MAMTPPPTVASPAAATTCPSCHAPVAAGMRFCGQCGAAVPSSAPGAPTGGGPGLPPPPPPSPASAGYGPGAPPPPPSVDIRQRVDQDRGFLKKIQLLLPGFRGYREGEDIRDADSLLRRQIADKLVAALGQLQQARQNLVQANRYGSLNDLAVLLSDLTVLEGRIRHAEQGYSGISATIRIAPQQLDQLYEYDYGFVLAADQLTAALGPLLEATAGNDDARVTTQVAQLRAMITQLRAAFQARMTTIEGIRV